MEKEINVEEQLKRLQEIVNKIESSSISIDESISLYEEGQKIIKSLENALQEAEKKVETIVQSK